MIWMDERTVTIPIQDLGLSTRSIRALLRMNIPTLNELVKRDSRDLSANSELDAVSIREISELLAHADEVFDRFEARQRRIDEIFDSIKDFSINDVSLSTAAKTALVRGHILMVSDMLRMSQADMMKLYNAGNKTRADINAAIEEIIAEGPAYFSHSHTSEQTEQDNDAAEPTSGKGFDYAVIDLLSEQFNFKPIRMAEWFDLSRQGIYNIMEKRTGKHHETWTGKELTTDGARERHIADLKQCIVHDNVVYFPTDSRTYRVLSTYCYGKGYVLNDYIQSLGFVRTTERPELTQDALEQDMQVHQSDGKFEDKVFAAYPLIGSKILKPETLEQLNTLARKYIDTVLGNPRAALTLRAEMQITLALINHAKNWKSEENSNFWSYISLQFGYRDASGAVVRLLQNALEHAMKHNRRLFIEDATGRAFKSTVVIHALTTRKSWMLLFDFLFDFYKNNLNWNVIPGDPLLAVMTRSLQQKLAGDSAEDMELTISSRVYSFQEGIRKLVLYRPVFTQGLFEKLITKIDALVNSEDSPAKTYEEQLCEEWFKEKITAIAGTKRTARRGQSGVRDVAMETSINDSLMVVCNDDFYVCPHCGYAESTTENLDSAGFHSYQKTLERKHITPWGKTCNVKLTKNKLCHVFRTDVVRLVFATSQANSQDVMLSVMYALLEALSAVLDIERNDIKGCLYKIIYGGRLIYSIVLYDAVAGGAGHVRRLVTADGAQFRRVVEKAIAITKGCNCSPSCYSCLRNYYNQKIHDKLNRKYAYDFLENYSGEPDPITNEAFETLGMVDSL